MADMTVCDQRADDVQHHPAGELRRVVIHVVGGRDLHDFHSAEPLRGNGVNHLQGLARKETAGFRRSGAGRKSRIDGVDVEREINGLAAFPGHLQCDLRSLARAVHFDVLHGEDAGAAPLCDGGAGPVSVPTANADLHQILGMAIRQSHVVHVAVIPMRGAGAFVRGPKPRRRVHPLVHILLLDVDMAVDVDDADIAVDMRRNAANVRKAEAVVAAADDRKDAGRVDVRDGLGDLVEGLLDVSRDDENIACVAEVEFLIKVHTPVEPIAVVKCGDAAHGLRPEARARPVGRRGIEGDADESCFVVADLADVFAIGRLHEGIDAGEGWLMAAAEQRDIAIDHGVRCFQPQL
jgi:hypothetical protein